MRSILLIHKPHYRQRSRVCKAGTGITVDVSSEERTSDLPGRWKHVTCFVIGRKDKRLADWRWRQYSRSLCDALPATLQSTKPHYRQPGRVCKAGTVVTVDVSSEERTSDLPGRWKHRPASWLVGRTRHWLTGYDVRGRVLLSWPVGWCFKSRKAWTSALCRWNSWPVWSRFFFSAGCTLKPVSWPSTALTTDTSAGSIRVGLRVTKVPSM